ncbi:hypothetical protein DS745_09200 [Anaerobacillus alkaliphilus]|uniref:Uncharacterized protein n=1 Tax=Anaerobacillus alkaliphilus TaxID=1548597 RepID=A0A4Q0VUQ2_9BACI|nr:hypothetical protein [Anaerobacillus alkaliphilus]RXJ01647.1 hypothetical protein DS745_09200 [Anaerobacillus alkaliphilus]
MLKNIMISFMSIVGVFLLLGIAGLFLLSNEPTESSNQLQEKETTQISAEIEEEEAEPMNTEFFRSNLKIISID